MTGYLVSCRRHMDVTSVDVLPFDMIGMAPVHAIVPSQPKQGTIAPSKREDHGKIADVDHVFSDYDREHTCGSFDNQVRALVR